MRVFIITLSICSVLAAPALATTAAGPAKLGFDVFSQYVWRGAVMADAVAVQPSASFGLTPGLRLGLWGSFAAQDRDVWEPSDRVDIMLDYSRPIGAPMMSPFNFRAGIATYTFPNGIADSKHTEEVYVGLEASLPSMDASLMIYRDFNMTESTYIKAAFSPPATAMPVPMMDLDVSVGFSDWSDAWEYNDITTTLSLGLPMTPIVDAGPAVGYTHSNSDLFADNSNWWAGVMVRINP